MSLPASESEARPTPNVVLSSPPFVTVDGVMNIRTLGGYPATPGTITKPMHVFRSAELSGITNTGKEQLQALGIRKVFDIRSAPEITRFNAAVPVVDGVQFVSVPAMTEDEAFQTKNIEALLQRFKDDVNTAFMDQNRATLKMAGSSFKVIFSHLRDSPEEPCIVHCSAGKDRAGLFSALLLMLLGVSDADIVKDYTLTAQGLGPFAALLIPQYQQIPIFRDNWTGFLNMGSTREETIVSALDMIRTSFGGAEGYLKEYAGLTNEDLTKIRANLLVDVNEA